jgi:MFS family permease
MVGFSPVAAIVSKIYSCNIVIVEMQMILFVIMFIPSNFVVIYMLNNWGLRWTLVTGGAFVVAGAWTRLLIAAFPNFLLVCIGSLLVAFGQVCFVNSVSKVASMWFSDTQRSLSTALGGISIPFGSIVGFILPSLILNEKDVDNITTG